MSTPCMPGVCLLCRGVLPNEIPERMDTALSSTNDEHQLGHQQVVFFYGDCTSGMTAHSDRTDVTRSQRAYCIQLLLGRNVHRRLMALVTDHIPVSAATLDACTAFCGLPRESRPVSLDTLKSQIQEAIDRVSAYGEQA